MKCVNTTEDIYPYKKGNGGNHWNFIVSDEGLSRYKIGFVLVYDLKEN